MTTPREERPRPQYGEYATPEEQRAHIREPLPEYIPEPIYTTATTPQTPPPAYAVNPAVPAPAPRRAGSTQRAITLGLLAMGIVQILMTAVSFLGFSDALTETFMSFGLSREVADQPRPQLWGTTMLLILIVGFLVTAYLSVKRMQAEKSSWWVALVGGAVTWIIVYVIMAVVLISDPAFQALVDMTSKGMLP